MRISTVTAGCLATICFVAYASSVHAWERQVTLDRLVLATNSYWNGADLSGGFRDENVHFNNTYNPDWWSWSGFAYSNVGDTNTAGYGNQYAVWAPGKDVSGTGNYAIAYFSAWDPWPTITMPRPGTVKGLYVNNTTYVALTLLNGDSWAKKFGGDTGDDPDWLLLTIVGRDEAGTPVGTNLFYLADYRFTNNAGDYIVGNWTWIDLSGMGAAVKTVEFSMSSSDTGAWGMNTPSYFALDGLQADFAYEPAAGQVGTTAVHMDDAELIDWATGWTGYNVGADCNPEWQTPSNAVGKADGIATDIVCLGRGGEITMTFDTRIANGSGSDFAVFENSFSDSFLELGYVEVSSDGVNFFRFRNHSMTTNPVPFFGGAVAPTAIDGYCSKYSMGYGTPFDLAELKDVSPLLDVNNVKYVKIVDIPGDGSCVDSFGNVIYDPYPTTNSAGVDLDAVGVLNTSHIVASSAGPNGSISPVGTVYVAENTDQSFTVTPDAHYHIADVLVDGVSVGAGSPVVVTNVISNRTIHATFANDAPAARMQTPVEGGEYCGSSGVTLMGDGMDREDGQLTSNLYWESSIDGMLATGTLVKADSLSVGVHAISLHVVDGAGVTGTVVRSIEVLADDDGDGIPNEWESTHYGGNTNAVASADDDKDGLTSYGEWLAGTLPNSATSCLRVAEAGTNGVPGFVIRWLSVSNRVYEIKHATNLVHGFVVLDTVPATPPVNTYTNDNSGMAKGFYRLGVSQ